jgi:GT2 family glycosyltransferase
MMWAADGRQRLNSVCAVTVTYGDRYEQLALGTINRALTAGASHVVVVDNGSSDGSRLGMQRDFGQDRRVTIVRLESNLGSAAGFARGMKSAAEIDTNLIWLLDDDNWVEPDTLNRLLATRSSATEHYCDPLAAVSGYRNLDSDHVRIAEGRPASIVFPPVGAFLSFDIFHYVRRHLPVRRAELEMDDLCLPNAPYGGLLFPTGLLELVGLPPVSYFLYVDDTVWTSRIVESGHRIVLDRSAAVHDADEKWSRTAGSGPRGLLASADERRLYYSVRNRVHYERSRIERPEQFLRYQVNKFLFTAFALTSRFGRNKANYLVFARAVKDGRNFTLKENDDSL